MKNFSIRKIDIFRLFKKFYKHVKCTGIHISIFSNWLSSYQIKISLFFSHYLLPFIFCKKKKKKISLWFDHPSFELFLATRYTNFSPIIYQVIKSRFPFSSSFALFLCFLLKKKRFMTLLAVRFWVTHIFLYFYLYFYE